MIVSASRRTDIPAFYLPWLLRRLQEGYALARNPRNPRQVSRVPLNRAVTDCMVLWSKNPAPLLQRLPELEGFGIPFYVQATLNAYGPELERGLPPLERRVETVRALSRILGPQRLVWRYDPVLLTEKYCIRWHLAAFERLSAVLEEAAEECIFSFLDLYRHMGRLPGGAPFRQVEREEMLRLAEGFSQSARRHGFRLNTCCEEIDLRALGIGHASCIDRARIEALLFCPIEAKKDSGQRTACGCVESVDIGAYHCCPHGCLYCYANHGAKAARAGAQLHDPRSPLLLGHLLPGDRVTDRRAVSLRREQTQLF